MSKQMSILKNSKLNIYILIVILLLSINFIFTFIGKEINSYLLFFCVALLLIFSKRFNYILLGIPLISAYLLLLSSMGIPKSIIWLIHPIPEASTFMTNITGINVGIITLLLGINLYKLKRWSVYIAILCGILFLSSILFQAFDIWYSTHDISSFIKYLQTDFFIGLSATIYLILIAIKYKHVLLMT
jgi:hypothetical protein